MPATSPDPKGKILLVDDDPGLLRLLSIRLRAEGYDVEAVESAHKALATLNRFSPDLVITDIKMPGMNGFELLTHMSQDYPDIPVVAVSGYVDIDRLKKLKFTRVVEKPVHLDDLRKMGQTWLHANLRLFQIVLSF